MNVALKAENEPRDHGGGLDAAMARYGGQRADWLDLSTGINPRPYPLHDISADAWNRLPDDTATDALLLAARRFWNVPDSAQIIAAPGASSLIARIPDLTFATSAYIPGPTYNEHAAAFAARKRLVSADDAEMPVHVYVHPNNPDGRLWPDVPKSDTELTIIDESFCDTCPEQSRIDQTAKPGTIVLKSFGKFWGLAGLRLGFAIGQRRTIGRLDDLLGPWPVAGPALEIGARALGDDDWADATRIRLARDAARLDARLDTLGASLVGGTDLFRTYAMPGRAADWQAKLARAHVWTRVFPYSETWMRIGLPGSDADWAQLEAAL
ncbi:threonine-phosphate decarboxylase [Gymnodinialimonas ulvae]|uniref:threonine-phosphate decarboxylase n=1 Tax=Gymnodinialimonas ulvae TaxID=3126504 RepID=UPI0030AD705C